VTLICRGAIGRGKFYNAPQSHFGSVRQLVDAIMQYLALNPKGYVWRAKGEEILAKDPTSLESGPWREHRCHYYLRDA
jgi:hypothetical protein